MESEESIDRARSFSISNLPSILINENGEFLISGIISEEKLKFIKMAREVWSR